MLRMLGMASWFLAVAQAQTTQGLIAGRVIDAITGQPLAGAEISVTAGSLAHTSLARSASDGFFTLPLLSPGLYTVRAAAPGYQPREVHEQTLAVAGRLDYEFRLRPLSDVWERSQTRSVFLPGKTLLPFFGPDLDFSRSASFLAETAARGSLDAGVSNVIDADALARLPLNGRDPYALIVTQPGAVADAATARGLGLAFNGQRPSASNFLLDGMENNNALITGPLATVAPEAVDEYRVSTNNFSAEYGRTSGYLANVITRAAGTSWHALAYVYAGDTIFNAAAFQQNAHALPRTPRRELQPGVFAGGPILRDRLFASGAFEYYRLRSRLDPETYRLPVSTAANALLSRFPAPGSGLTTFTAPSSLDRYLALPRVDWLRRGGLERYLVRAAVPTVRRPDFLWTPYPDFVTPLTQSTAALAAAAQLQLRPRLAIETRIGWTRDQLRFDRPHPEVPTLATADGTTLPGSPAFYSFRNRTRNLELVHNTLWSAGRHEVKFGGALLDRHIDGYLTAGRDSFYGFAGIDDFLRDRPFTMSAALTRIGKAPLTQPDYERSYRHRQWSLFVQDTWKLTPSLALHLGLRYERLGAPVNTGAVKDALLSLGPGASLAERLASTATRVALPGPGDQPLYDADPRALAPRAGFSLALPRRTGLVLRGSYGIFYDRPFDNQWQNLRNNNLLVPAFTLSTAAPVNYLGPVSTVLGGLTAYQLGTYSRQTPDLTLYQPGLRNGYAQSWFLGLRRESARAWSVEANALGSLSRRLITTDAVNRDFSLVPAERGPGNGTGRLNPTFFTVNYRANQGLANYAALSLAARYRGPVTLLAAYTLSHTIDNQSEPLAGDFFNLSFTRFVFPATGVARSAFSRQFDSRADRGNSDFDQRHSFVFSLYGETPRVRRIGRFSFGMLGALRSGFPYSVYSPPAFPPPANGQPMLNIRATRVAADPPATAAVGGQRLLAASSFAAPPSGQQGNTGRNAFTGPGAASLDLSLGRSFAFRPLGEAARITLRADAVNLLNHANLGQPASYLPSSDFGIAPYGRSGFASTFPALAPFQESARRLQLLLRVQF